MYKQKKELNVKTHSPFRNSNHIQQQCIINCNNDNLLLFINKDHISQENEIKMNPSIVQQVHSQNGNSLLYLSVEHDNYVLTKLLIDNNADVNAQNHLLETPLHKAVEIGNHKVINLLLEKGANPNTQTHIGKTPMHIAASKGDYKVIKLLLLYKADVSIKSNEGYTAEDYATHKGYQKCIDVLSKVCGVHSNNSSDRNIVIKHQQRLFKDSHLASTNSELVLVKSVEDCNVLNAYCHNNNNNNIVFSNLIANGMDYNGSNSNSNSDNCDCRNTVSNVKWKYNYNYNHNLMNDVSFGDNIFLHYKQDANIPTPRELFVHFNFDNEMNNINNTHNNNNTSLLYKPNEPEVKIIFTFYDSNPPLITFTSTKNDIIFDNCTRESTFKHLRKNNTLHISKKDTYCYHHSADNKPSIFKPDKSSDVSTPLSATSNHEFSLINSTPNDSSFVVDAISDDDDDNEEHSTNNINTANLFNYLNQINMSQYTDLFIKEGFDDIDILLKQMKGKKTITDSVLKQIGINIPGHRARILIKLQLDINMFDIKLNHKLINEQDVFYISHKNMSEYNKDKHLYEMYKWFREIKLPEIYPIFYYKGYHSVDLFLIQMLSITPLNEDILLNEFNITKLGHRLRIMNKLHEDSNMYMNKIHLTSTSIAYEPEHESKFSCNCMVI